MDNDSVSGGFLSQVDQVYKKADRLICSEDCPCALRPTSTATSSEMIDNSATIDPNPVPLPSEPIPRPGPMPEEDEEEELETEENPEGED